MVNIVLRRFVVLVYIVICLVFVLSPYMGGKDKKFGVKVEKVSGFTVNMSILYTFASMVFAAVFIIVCVIKNSFIFTNISIFLYIVLMSSIYFKIRQKLKSVFARDILREFIINNPPKSYLLKLINPFFYVIYLVPIIISFFVGKGDTYFIWVLAIQVFIALVSFALNILICKLKNHVDDDVDESVKKNLKYRKMWNVNVFFALFAISASISVMYAEYKKLIYIGGLGEWLPFSVIAVAVAILIFYSLKHYKK